MHNPEGIKALVAKWRAEAATSSTYWKYAVSKCADELESLTAVAGDAEVVDGWPEYVMLRDTKLHDDAGGLGQRIFTTAGAGYEKRKYVRADLVTRQAVEGMVLVPREPTREMVAAGTLGGILTPNQACASYQAQVLAAAAPDASVEGEA